MKEITLEPIKSLVDININQFPVIITFENFLREANATLMRPFPFNERKKLIDYPNFVNLYYGSFSDSFKSRFSSSLVFTEIMSTIKGFTSFAPTLLYIHIFFLLSPFLFLQELDGRSKQRSIKSRSIQICFQA